MVAALFWEGYDHSPRCSTMSSILHKLATEFELLPDVVHDRTTVLRLLSAYFLLR